jgi:hypothetical protein
MSNIVANTLHDKTVLIARAQGGDIIIEERIAVIVAPIFLTLDQ